MGNLYGSEYWTYLLPRYAGAAHAEQITRARLPMGAREARAMGLLDEWFGRDKEDFERQLVDRANTLAASADYDARLEEKRAGRRRDEANQPLARYRDEELEKMRLNFYGFDPSYHVARYNFVYKVPRSRTPLTLASHRRTRPAGPVRNAS
jgi:putative two-component system hydrogenase maturation factor HypX/HoxX